LNRIATALLFATAAFLCSAASISAQGVSLFPPPGGDDSGEREMKTLAEAYPDRINQVARVDGDWAVDVDGQWFFWAAGRILPQAERWHPERYARFRFYPYPLGSLPPLPRLDDQTMAMLKKALKEARIHPPRRSESFLERLYGAGSRAETESQLVTVGFLGFPVRVHQRIVGELAEVAAECANLRQTDPQAASFLAGLSEVDGFNYRDIVGTATRSYHSYGLAIDLIPRSYGGKSAYWRWVMWKVDDWWTTPYEQRWMVPLSIVAIFEKHGFIWGGKWLFFDTMHFEYRPEILILAKG